MAGAMGVAMLWGMAVPPAAADHDDGVYELVSYGDWDHGDLKVLIVPPAHGQLFNFETSVLNNGDPNELTPFNTYLEAIEAAITSWDDAINLLGADWLKEYYEPTVYVLGRDNVPPEVLTAPDILVYTDENHGPSLGTSVWARSGHVRTPCFVRISSSWYLSFTFADMYNVAAQEYGHCLALGHVGSQGGVDPTSEQKHPEHDVMNGFYPHMVGEAGTHLHCVSNLDIAALEHVFDYELAYSAVLNSGVQGLTLMPVGAYGDTCVEPPADWRAQTPPPVLPGAPPMNSAIVMPVDEDVLASGSFKRVKGTFSVAETSQPIEEGVRVALASIGDDGSCTWWQEAAGTFASRDCYSPLWMETQRSGDEWAWKVPKGLPEGRYRVISRVVTDWGNEPLEEDNTLELTLAPSRARIRK